MTAFGNNKVAVGKYLDSTSAMRDALTGISNNITEQQKMKAAQDQLALDNARADARLGISQAQEADRVKALADKAMYDKTLSDIFSGMKDTKDVTTTKTIAGSNGNIADVNAAKAYNKNITDLQQGLNTDYNKKLEDASIKYSDLLTRAATHGADGEVLPVTIPVDSSNEVIEKTIKRPGGSTVTDYITKDGDQIGGLRKAFGGYETVDAFTPEGARTDMPGVTPLGYDMSGLREINVTKSPPSSDPVISEEAHQKALKESGLADLVNRLDTLGSTKEVPTLKGATPDVKKEITKQVKLKPEEQISNLRNSILNSTLPGSYKMEAMSKIDTMFPKGKEMTVGDQIQILKLNNDITKQNAAALKEVKTIDGIKSMYPGMPANVVTLEGAKMWANKIDKSKENKTPFIGSLYDNLTTKDSGDVSVLDKWVKRNETYLNGLNTAQKNALLSRMKAGYAHESSNDLSDYLGGTAFGDMVDTLGIDKLK